MKKYLLLVSALILGVILAACSSNETDGGVTMQSTEKEGDIEAVLSFASAADTDEPVAITVDVTKDGKAVEEASVLFNMWESTSPEQVTPLMANDEGKGKYQTTLQFEDEGTYHIQAVVDVEGTVVEPEAKLVIGEVEEQTTVVSNIPEQTKRFEETPLTVELKTAEGEALSEREVYYEVMQNELVVEKEVKAEETSPGVYTANYEFKNPGDYKIRVMFRELEESIEEEFEIHVEDE